MTAPSHTPAGHRLPVDLRTEQGEYLGVVQKRFASVMTRDWRSLEPLDSETVHVVSSEDNCIHNNRTGEQG